MQTASRYPWGKGTQFRTAADNAVCGATGVQIDPAAGKITAPEHLSFDIVASGNAGNRVLVAFVTDGANIHWISPATGDIIAGQRGGLDIEFGGIKAPDTTARRNLSNTAALTGAYVRCACPIKLIPNPGRVQVYDSAGIDNAGDRMYWRYSRMDYDM